MILNYGSYTFYVLGKVSALAFFYPCFAGMLYCT